MKDQIILLSARYIDMKDNETQRIIQGVSVKYVETLEPQASKEKWGVDDFKSFLTPDKLDKLSAVPAIYEGTFEKVSTGGKMTLKLVDIDFIGLIDEDVKPKKSA